MSRFHRIVSRPLLAVGIVVTLMAGVTWAYWTTTSVPGGNAASGATAVNPGSTPTATAAAHAVTVSWTATTLASGQAVSGYVVKRYSGATAQPVLSGCSGTLPTTTCTENGVPVGSWTYSITPVFGTNWTGAESSKSTVVTVSNQAPVAVADAYSMTEDASLSIGGPGVLGNDTDAEGDALSAAVTSGVSNGTLTFTSTGAFTYAPAANASGVDSFTYQANDGLQNSNVVTVTLTVSAVNDAPVNDVPTTQQTPKNTNVVFSAATNNLVAISDVDAGGASMVVRLNATSGTVTLPATTGLTFTVGDGTADATMTFSGTISTINARLDGLTFIPTNGFTGSAALQIVTSDQGNTGAGGTLTDTDSITIAVNALGIFTANQDIGGPGVAGSTAFAAGTYTVKGGGADIWNASDQFQLVHRPVTGDVRITARVVSQSQTTVSAAAKAGVMFRDTLGATSIHGMADVMQSNGTEFHWRLTTGGSSGAGTSTTGIAAPYWVRLTRIGNQLTAEKSTNGTTWTAQGAAQTVTMGAALYAGLAVSAVNNASLNTASFDGVSLNTPPTAVADTYSVNENSTLTVPAATGVLANDTDPESNALTAAVASAPPGMTLNADGSFTYTPPANFSGAVLLQYKANDGVFNSGTANSVITVNQANLVPSFAKGANQSVQKNLPSQTVNGWATAISQGTGETGQDVNFIVTNSNPALFTVQPSIGPTGDLTYGSTAGSTGVATVSVAIHDNGGTAFGGHDTSAVQTFTITITADTTGPTGGSIDASGLVGTGGRYSTSTTLSLILAKGTDPSGIAATGATVTRASATLTSAAGADGVCGSFGSYALITGGNDPASPKSDTVADQACYSYRYLVADTVGNQTTYTSPNIKVDTTAPAAPALVHSAFTNTYWSGGASTTVFYRSAAGTGSFTTTATTTDAVSGIASYAFPALGANWIMTPGSLGVMTYSWSAITAIPGAKSVSATNNASGTSAGAPFTPLADDTAPTTGTVTYPNSTQSGTTVSVTFTTGTDGGSGIGTRLLQRASATLNGGACGTFGAFTTVAGGTNPTSPFLDTVSRGTCYMFRYVVSDNVNNQGAAATSSNVVTVLATYFNTVSATAGLQSYWRLGEATTSSDSFTGTTGTTLQAHVGEIGASWTKNTTVSNGDAVITDATRIRKSGTSSLALYYTSGTPASANYTVEADVYVASNLANDMAGVVGRLDPAVAFGTFYIGAYNQATGSWELYAVVNGTKTLLGSSTTQALVAGTTYRLSLDMTGTSIRLLVDGVAQTTAVDSSITAAGRAGLALGNGSTNTTVTDTTGMHLNNFTVTPPVADSFGATVGDYFGGPALGVAGAIGSDSNTAALVDGVNEYAAVASPVTNDFSLEFWFKSTQGIGTDPRWSQGAGLVDANVSGTSNDFGISLRSDGRLVAGVGGGSGDTSIVSTNGGYNDGRWHYVVFTRIRATGAIQLYVDGVAAGSATASTLTLTAPTINIGRLASGANYLAGTLDEVAIYNTPLSQATVTNHFAAGV